MVELMIYVVFVIVIVGIAGSFVGCAFTTSDGMRRGTVTKLSHKGIIFKTYEGELTMGGMVSTESGMQGNVWQFSVRRDNPKRDAIIQSLTASMESNTVVCLKYKQARLVLPWQAETSYDIVSVAPVPR